MPEKNDLNSILFPMTPGVEGSKAGTLLSALVFFKRLHDDNRSLEDAIPRFVGARPQRYRRVRLRDLGAEMHAFYRDAGISELQRAQFRAKHSPEMALPPHEAMRRLVRNDVEYLPLDQREGRIATTLWVAYPPGIATVIPGERLDERAKPIMDYLKMFERAANLFRGLENEIQGVFRETQADAAIRLFTYVTK